ncbi:hypothetical protein [Streptomyces griseus]|uniref:hypothetical protein n=1 Tax=Streptomyces griseus TaxID=1911 RepID=UPI0036375F31
MDAGIAAIIGAAIGAAGSACTAAVAGFWARNQVKLQLAAQERQVERQAREGRLAQIREPRKQVYADFANQGAVLVQQLAKLKRALESPQFSWDAVDPYLDDDTASDRLVQCQHAVSLEGPEDINYLALSTLRSLLRARAHAVAWALKRAGSPIEEELQPEVETAAALESAQSTLTKFRHSAMLVLRTEGEISEVEAMKQRARRLLSDLSD